MDRLFAGIERFGEAPALIDERQAQVSYAELVAEADRIVAPLGSRPRLLAIEAANARAPLAAYVGALRAGHVVLLAGEGGAAETTRFARTFQPQAVFRRDDGGGWAFEAREAASDLELHPELAVLLSTSGTTGDPKLIRLSHAGLLANAAAIAEYLELAPGERAIASLPPHYSYGMSVINSHLLHGHALVLTDLSVADPGFWPLVDRSAATSFAGVPHSYELLERSGFLERSHPSLRYYTQAGGRLPPERGRRFAQHAAAQGRRFYIMYGQTEAGPRMAYVPPALAAEHADCIGVPVPGGAFALDFAPGAGPDGPGELTYRGPNVMMGYATCREDLARGREVETLRTGDLAERTSEGLWRITGRASRFSKLFGLRIGLDDVEARLAAAGVDAAVAGDDARLVVVTAARGQGEAVARVVTRDLKLPASAYVLLERDAIPRLPNGKTDYGAILSAGRAQATATPASRKGPLRERIGAVVGVARPGDHDSFVTLGGDSLNYVVAALVLEEALGQAPDGWERMTFAELDRLKPVAPPRFLPIDSSILIRGLAIFLVVFHHVTSYEMAGAAFALLAVAGYNFSRFQLPRMIAGQSWVVIRSMLAKVLVPYFIVLTLTFASKRFVFWPQYFLVSNFTTGVSATGARRLTIYWFLESYIDIFVAVGLLFLLRPVRRWAARWPFGFAAGLLALATAVRLGGSFAPLGVFFKNGAVMMAYVFAFGWAVGQARGWRERAALAVFAVAGFGLLPPAYQGYGLPVLWGLSLLLVAVSKVPVGTALARALSVIGGASLYIYIVHPILLQPVRQHFGGPVPPLWVLPVILLCLAAGIGVWRGVEWLEGWRGRRRAGREVEPAPA